MKGIRADLCMIERGLVPSREKAQQLILSGRVRLNGRQIAKPSELIAPDAPLSIETFAYVSRGGMKLEKAFEVFPLNVVGRLAADIGASTGGFTDCMLQRGARRVYAIDVGYGQLAWSLRNDSRVIVRERTNARHMCPDWFDAPLDFASIDVSFISVLLILAPLFRCLREDAEALVLVKPQFEAGRENVGKKGVVRDPAVHARVLDRIVCKAGELGYSVAGLDFSPIRGPEGNIEFLLYLRRAWMAEPALDITNVVGRAHEQAQ